MAVVWEIGICAACGHASGDGTGSIGAALAPIVADYSGEGRCRRMFADGNHVSAGTPVIMESGAPAIMRLMRLEISRRHIAHDDYCRKMNKKAKKLSIFNPRSRRLLALQQLLAAAASGAPALSGLRPQRCFEGASPRIKLPSIEDCFCKFNNSEADIKILNNMPKIRMPHARKGSGMTAGEGREKSGGGAMRADSGRMGICRDFLVILQLRQLNTN